MKTEGKRVCVSSIHSSSFAVLCLKDMFAFPILLPSTVCHLCLVWLFLFIYCFFSLRGKYMQCRFHTYNECLTIISCSFQSTSNLMHHAVVLYIMIFLLIFFFFLKFSSTSIPNIAVFIYLSTLWFHECVCLSHAMLSILQQVHQIVVKMFDFLIFLSISPPFMIRIFVCISISRVFVTLFYSIVWMWKEAKVENSSLLLLFTFYVCADRDIMRST